MVPPSGPDAAGFLPHGFCFTWNPSLLTLHVLSDTLIGLAYISIPLTLLYLVRKRGDLPFNSMFLLFAAFIVSCGMTHWMDVWTLWHPDYWLSGFIKAFTAAASIGTAAALIQMVPAALRLPTLQELQHSKALLEREIAQRKEAEHALREEQASLALRVEERTRELRVAMADAEELKTAAETANKMKDQFLARVSHELRTPLQATLGWVQVLGHEQLGDDKRQMALERIKHNVALQARMIDDLLDIARILGGKLRLELAEVDPVATVERAIEIVQPRAQSRGIRLELQIDGAVARMLSDATRLQQVVWNLLINAVNASHENGRVLARVGADASRVWISVQDWGKGIESRHLPFIFEPFRQLEAGDTHGGLGLGLAITRNIVELFGGTLSARSSGLGEGSTFVVELPHRRVAAHVEPPTPSDRPLSRQERQLLRGLRVLYVEDAVDIAESVRLMLADQGMDVEACTRYDDALERIQRWPFEVLLTDLHLDGLHSGLDLARVVRASDTEVPIIALSALGTEADMAATRAAGFDAHLVKPLNMQKLAVTIATLVMRRRGIEAAPVTMPMPL